MPAASTRPWPGCPLVVAYGLGVDSTAVLIEFARRAIRPDPVLFADTGGEKPETYAYLPVMQEYLSRVGLPPVVTVCHEPVRAACQCPRSQPASSAPLPRRK